MATLSVHTFNVAVQSKGVGEVESEEHVMWNSVKAGKQQGNFGNIASCGFVYVDCIFFFFKGNKNIGMQILILSILRCTALTSCFC